MVDRFGALPDALKHLFRTAELKLAGAAAGIERIDVGARNGRLVFARTTGVDPFAIVRLAQEAPETYRFRPADGGDPDAGGRLLVSRDLPEPEQRFAFVEELLKRLTARRAPRVEDEAAALAVG